MFEAYIDFPDEDLPAENRLLVLKQLDELIAGTHQLLATTHYGELLREGIKTVILGEPNAGKSSLLNRLVGRERALVSPEPGTTRDYIEERIIVGPHWLRLIDTAGLNEMPSSLEKQGIDKTFEQAAAADLFLWVVDSTQARPVLPPAISSRMTAANTILILNKVDLPFANSDTLPAPFQTAQVSALAGTGFDQLQGVITSLAESFRVETGDEVIAINARHAHALGIAQSCLASAIEKIRHSESSELVSSDLRVAMDAFGQISGKIDNERMLDQLFASFCIGK